MNNQRLERSKIGIQQNQKSDSKIKVILGKIYI